MRVVVDASVAVEVVLRRESADRALTHILSADEGAYAPDLINAEVLHALRRYRLARTIAAGRARQAVSAYLDLPIARYPTSPLLDRVWSLADRFTAYDAMYVALAEGLEARLLTGDRRLRRTAARLVDVVVT